MNLRPRSIRVRLTLWYATVLALILAGFSVAVFLFVRTNLLHEIDERSEQSLAVIQRLVAEDPQDAAEIEEHNIVSLFAVVQDGAPAYTSAAWTRQELPDPASVASEPRLRRWQSGSGNSYAIASLVSTAAEPPLTLLVAIDESPVLDHLRTLGLVLLLGFPAALLAAVLGGAWLAKRMLSPVGAMARAAAGITADRLSDRLPIDDPQDEFGQLAGVFNQTLERLQDAFLRLRRFTSDASHELRTPLTALRSVGETSLRAPHFHDQCRETIVSMLEESERLTQLVDGLLVLTRESTEAYRARFAAVDVGLLAGEVVELLRALAEEKDQRIDLVVDGLVVVHGDRSTLRQALVNLVDNAIKYTQPGGSIQVSVRSEGPNEVIAQVTDTGPGIAAEHGERVFERFYRVDDARARATGGAGLGLAIARWAVELNGGRVELESEPGRGSSFRIRLPRALLALAPLFFSLSCSREPERREPAEASRATRTLFTFDGDSIGQLPPGWTSAGTQANHDAASWCVLVDESAPSKPNVLSLSNENRDPGREFNLCWNEGVRFQDGRLEISLKANSGQEDQGGGPIWRVQDKDNYYVCRANPLENNFRVYYVKDGSRTQLATADARIPTGQWQRIAIEQRGEHIACFLNGEKLLEVTDKHIPNPGGVGVWTKADAASSFDDITLVQ